MQEHGIAFRATDLGTLHVNIFEYVIVYFQEKRNKFWKSFDFVGCFITSDKLSPLLALVIYITFHHT